MAAEPRCKHGDAEIRRPQLALNAYSESPNLELGICLDGTWTSVASFPRVTVHHPTPLGRRPAAVFVSRYKLAFLCPIAGMFSYPLKSPGRMHMPIAFGLGHVHVAPVRLVRGGGGASGENKDCGKSGQL